MRYRERHERESSHIAHAWVSAAIVAAGIALRVWQYLGRSALWTDEATLANNIATRSLGLLVRAPLDHSQAAPVGFLLIEKLAASLFGVNELALRAFPLLASVVAMLLLWRIAHRLLPPAAIPIVLVPFAFAPPLIFHAAEVKQYSSDIAIALGLLLVALELESLPLSARRIIGASAAGMIAVWLSQPAVLVVFGIGAALVAFAVTSEARRTIARVSVVMGAWAASAIAAIAVSEHHLTPAVHRYLNVFWRDGFWPLSLHRANIVTWPFLRIASTLGSQLALPRGVALGGAVLIVVGTWAAWRRDRRTAMLVVAPVLATFGASAAQLYPFTGRLVLFLVPLLLLLLAAGVTAVAEAIEPDAMSLGVFAGATVLLAAVAVRTLRNAPPVYRSEEITPAIAYLRAHAQSGELAYVYYGGAPAFAFYAAREHLDSASYVLGGCHRDDPRAYLPELDTLRGRARAWLLFAHELPRLRERDLMLRYLDAIGVARDSLVVRGHDVDGGPTSVRLYRYDLSDSARLALARATSFPVEVPALGDARLRCQEGIP